MSEFFAVYTCDFDSKYSVMIEDDGRVAYAYLLENNENIISDVWLYNQLITPLETEWKDSEMPFLNPIEFVKDISQMMPLQTISDIVISWNYSEDKLITAAVFIRGISIAFLKSHECPGWSSVVIKDGPLAKKMVVYQN